VGLGGLIATEGTLLLADSLSLGINPMLGLKVEGLATSYELFAKFGMI